MGNVSTKSASVAKPPHAPRPDPNASQVVQAIQAGNIFSALPLEIMHGILGQIAHGTQRSTVSAFARASHVTSSGAGKRLLTERIMHMVEVPSGRQAQLRQVQQAIQLMSRAGERRDQEQVMPLFKKIVNYVHYLAPKDRLLAGKIVFGEMALLAPSDRSELLLMMLEPYSNDKSPYNALATGPQQFKAELMLALDNCAELPVELRLPILLAICRSPERHLVLEPVLKQARALPVAEKAQVLAGLYFRMGYRPYPSQDLSYAQAVLKETLDLTGADLALVLVELIPTFSWSSSDRKLEGPLDQILVQLQAMPQACAAPLIAKFAELNKGVTDKVAATRRSDALRVMVAGFPDALAKAHGLADLAF